MAAERPSSTASALESLPARPRRPWATGAIDAARNLAAPLASRSPCNKSRWHGAAGGRVAARGSCPNRPRTLGIQVSRSFIFGDIHGELASLERVLEQLPPRTSR